MSATVTAIAQALQSAGLAQPVTTIKPQRAKFSDRRNGESLLAYENRMSERRENNRARMRDKRNALRRLVIDAATDVITRNENALHDAALSMIRLHDASIGLGDHVAKSDAVSSVIPARFRGRVVSATTRETIIQDLTTRFSRGMSAPRYKIRRPQWQDADEQFYARFTRNQTMYAHGEHTSSRAIDPMRVLRMHDASTLHMTPALQGNRDVVGTMSEALATGGQRADGMGKVTGMLEGSAALSSFFHRETVPYYTRDDGNLITAICKVVVSSQTGNSYLLPEEPIEAESVTIDGFAESCTNPAEYMCRTIAMKAETAMDRCKAKLAIERTVPQRSMVTISQSKLFGHDWYRLLADSVSIR